MTPPAPNKDGVPKVDKEGKEELSNVNMMK